MCQCVLSEASCPLEKILYMARYNPVRCGGSRYGSYAVSRRRSSRYGSQAMSRPCNPPSYGLPPPLPSVQRRCSLCHLRACTFISAWPWPDPSLPSAYSHTFPFPPPLCRSPSPVLVLVAFVWQTACALGSSSVALRISQQSREPAAERRRGGAPVSVQVDLVK